MYCLQAIMVVLSISKSLYYLVNYRSYEFKTIHIEMNSYFYKILFKDLNDIFKIPFNYELLLD
jgi:hypothetical protein